MGIFVKIRVSGQLFDEGITKTIEKPGQFGNPSPNDDPLRGQRVSDISEALRQVCADQRQRGSELGLVEIGSRNTEAVFYRGFGNHPFQAVAMEGTTPGVVVIGMSLNDEMTQLRMHPPVEGGTIDDSPTTDPGTDGDIHELVETPCRMFGRGYPEDMLQAFNVEGRIDGLEPSSVRSGDLDQIATPIDFLGLNFYTTASVAAGAEESDNVERPPGPDQPEGYTEMGWAIDPHGLRDYLGLVNNRYQPRSIAVTENGASYSDGP
ncbi:MAG: family 1 glycosylhydrolase, partial [Actinobacteria bacterium]|nr:family 1 glycosylhydrolase [Actinomycetota bacterium]